MSATACVLLLCGSPHVLADTQSEESSENEREVPQTEEVEPARTSRAVVLHEVRRHMCVYV